jgi:energy-coupling factor transport system ATP-binding protein
MGFRIELNDLHFSYLENQEVLHGISLTIEAGEQVAVVGQNGAGKTTLVKHFNGLLHPTEGSVHVGGWDTGEYSVAQLANRVGYVFQDPNDQLFCQTVYEEVSFGPASLEYPAERIKRLVEDALELTSLQGQEEVNPYDLSPTRRKMVAIASIIAMDTPIVIFDEPTTGQDAAHVARIGDIVGVLRERGKTVVAITHDIDFGADNFSRIIAMSEGQVLLDGPVLEVIVQEEVLATTYVEPPQLTRLGLRLGFAEAVRSEDEFLAALSRMREDGAPQDAGSQSRPPQ